MRTTQLRRSRPLNSAPYYRVDDRSRLNVGVPADVAILELREGTFEFLDNYQGTRSGRQRLFPVATVLAGKRVQAA